MEKIIATGFTTTLSMASAQDLKDNFLWGAASAACQVEGYAYEDGKGKSIWDYYLDDKNLAGPGVSGRVAINFYDRSQYLKDIQIMKSMGINSYRFSIAWARIIPDGLGPVNPKAIAHYRQFIDDLKIAGIKPLVTLYHWDMPLSLASAGGWECRDSVDWFKYYATVVFDNISDQVDQFLLVNEPTVEIATKIMAESKIKGKNLSFPPIVPTAPYLEISLKSYNHILLASAAAAEVYKDRGYRGRLGIALPFFPILTDDKASALDKKMPHSWMAFLIGGFLIQCIRGNTLRMF